MKKLKLKKNVAIGMVLFLIYNVILLAIPNLTEFLTYFSVGIFVLIFIYVILGWKFGWHSAVILAPLLVFNVLYAQVDSLDVTDRILGNLSWSMLWGAFIFGYLGMLLRWIWTTLRGWKTSYRTPKKFSWSFWFRDNLGVKLLSFFGNTIVMFVFFRFTDELVGEALSMFIAFVIGLCVDYFADMLKNISPDVAVNKKTNVVIK